jgi:hypothetical protein
MAQREVAIQDPLECSIAKRLLVEETWKGNLFYCRNKQQI